jgi:hypothetical protein
MSFKSSSLKPQNQIMTKTTMSANNKYNQQNMGGNQKNKKMSLINKTENSRRTFSNILTVMTMV